MNGPSLGEASVGAVSGAVVGSIGGLFAIGLAPAILFKNAALLFGTPMLGLFCWVVSGVLGWLLGGQIGPRLGSRFNSPRLEVVGGIAGGLVPVGLVALWGWYMVTGH